MPSPEKVMFPLILVRDRDSTRQPASRSKRIVPSEDSTFRSLLVTLSGDAVLASCGGHLTSRTLIVILSSVLSPRFSVPAYSYFLRKLSGGPPYSTISVRSHDSPGLTGPSGRFRCSCSNWALSRSASIRPRTCSRAMASSLPAFSSSFSGPLDRLDLVLAVEQDRVGDLALQLVEHPPGGRNPSRRTWRRACSSRNSGRCHPEGGVPIAAIRPSRRPAGSNRPAACRRTASRRSSSALGSGSPDPSRFKVWDGFQFVLYVSVFPSGNLYSSLTWARAACDPASARHKHCEDRHYTELPRRTFMIDLLCSRS